MTIGVTEVIGSTPATSTSASCSTKARMALISPRRCSTSSSATATRARCAIRRTVLASTDIEYPAKEAAVTAANDAAYSRPPNRPATVPAASKFGVFHHPPAERLKLLLGQRRRGSTD